jgi:3-oxoacyl-[acyl-carrier protein] reductase
MREDNDNRPRNEHAGPVILVTGASGAIGFEVARLAVARGAAIAMHASSVERAEAATLRIRDQQPAATVIPCPADFHESGSIEALVTGLVSNLGRLDAMIHCAITGAPGVTGVFAETNPASYGAHAALVMGSFQQLCFHARPHLARRGGAIVTFASDAGRFAAPRQSLVGAANAGLMGFARNLAVEVARDGIRVNCISPTFVENTRAFEKYAAGGRGDSAQACRPRPALAAGYRPAGTVPVWTGCGKDYRAGDQRKWRTQCVNGRARARHEPD